MTTKRSDYGPPCPCEADEECRCDEGPENDDWIHAAWEAMHPILPPPYYDGGRLIRPTGV